MLPDCTLHFCEQRTDEWRELRRGVLTASNFGPWLLKSDKTSAKAREKAVCQLLAEIAGCWEPPGFENAAMQRGTELEPEAVAAFEVATGKRVIPVGFCQSVHGRFGCSPDGLIADELSGIESKVPLPATHLVYRRAGELPDEYLFQIHGSMAVTGAQSWWFQSFNPGLAGLRIEVERNEFTGELKAALIAFSADVDKALAEEAEAWAAEFSGREEVAA